MDKVLGILGQVRPDVDFSKETTLIDDGILDSVDVLAIVAGIRETFGIKISLAELDPDDFNSADTIWNLIKRETGV